MSLECYKLSLMGNSAEGSEYQIPDQNADSKVYVDEITEVSFFITERHNPGVPASI